MLFIPSLIFFCFLIHSVEMYNSQLKGVHMAISGTTQRRKSTRGGSVGWEDPGRSYHDAMGWIAQQKACIDTPKLIPNVHLQLLLKISLLTFMSPLRNPVLRCLGKA